ncbi:acetyltransferase [Vibrio paracholerae]|nr:acetyltransferase [Vibrio paracholerae]
MVTVVVFEFSCMRCQPLRRALAQSRKIDMEVRNERQRICVRTIPFSN